MTDSVIARPEGPWQSLESRGLQEIATLRSR
jgi:hypothetical protein